jgi:hypothetical protein
MRRWIPGSLASLAPRNNGVQLVTFALFTSVGFSM